jgi:Domain of unknown function (DUF3644)
MPKGFPKTVKSNLEKCRSAAIAAVGSYNRPGSGFRTAEYLVMITIAWTALFHSIFYRRLQRPWFQRKTSGAGTAIRYSKIDGEPKHWDLAECLKQYYGSGNPPERKNLEFLLGLRNKIEHRHLPELDASLYGECQAALLNLEKMLTEEFGRKYALTEQLAVSLQFSRTIPAEKRRTAQVLASETAKTVKDYIEQFRGNLPSTVLNSMKYSFNVFLVPRVVNRKNAADVAVQFVLVDETSDEELNRLEKLNVLIREKHIPIANLDLFNPSQVVKKLEDRLPFQVNMATHTDAWKHFKVRPSTKDSQPEHTRSEYCIYDGVHRDYVYTQAWVEKLASELSTEDGYENVIGRKPRQNNVCLKKGAM